MKIKCLAIVMLCAALSSRAEPPALPTFTIAPGDVSKAAVVIEAADGATLDLTLTSSKQAEFTRITTDNVGKQIKLIIGGVVVSQPIVQAAIRGGTIAISTKSPDQALEQAKELFKHKP